MARSTRRNNRSRKITRNRKNLSMTRPKRGGKKNTFRRRASKKYRTRRFKKRGGMDPGQLYDSDGNENPEIAKLIADEQFQEKLDQLIANAKSQGKTPIDIAKLVERAKRNRKIMQGHHITKAVKGKFEDPKDEKVRGIDPIQPKKKGSFRTE